MRILATRVEPEGVPILEALPDCTVTPHALTPNTPGLEQAEALCVSVHDRVSAPILEAASRLRWVVTRSTGIDNVDRDACAERAIVAVPLPEYATEAVVEMAMASMRLLLRHAFAGGARTRQGRWDRAELKGRRLSDATVGVVGVGRIGKRVAALAAAEAARVVGHDIAPSTGFAPSGFAWTDSLDEVLEQADVLTLHVDLNPTSRGLIGAKQLDRLPEAAVLINTSRGEVVDTQALVDALGAGRLGGAHLDVLAGEPKPPLLARLAACPNVLVTPHLASFDEATIRRRYEEAARLLAVWRDEAERGRTGASGGAGLINPR